MDGAYEKAEKQIAKAKSEGATALDLRLMKLKEVPRSIRELTGLQTLYLSGNQISDISFLEKLTGLQTLYLRGNQISDISFLEKLTGLQTLDLSRNQISDYSFLEKLTGLQTLYLSGNQISDISFLEKLTGLQTLDLSRNQISDYSFLEKLTGLQTLYLRGNQISDISFLEKLTGLQTLYLSGNQISDISFLEKLTGLQTLDLSHNQISDISFLEKLTGLQTLDLRYNQISDISFLEKLTGLQTLYLRGNQISDYSFLEKLTGLQTLYLSGNQISDISFLEKLTGLQTLDLSHNQISDISFLEKLTGLQTLDLSHNQISDIRPLLPLIRSGQTISLVYRGRGISLGENPISSPPATIIEKGREAVLSWFEQAEEQGIAPLYEAKLMILGQGGAGKTTFARLQLDSKYDLEQGKPDSTLGIEIYEGKEFDHQRDEHIGKKIKGRLWDFGGQNIQKMLHQFFITEDCLYVLITDKRKENADFDYWFQIIHLLGPGSSVIVLENQMQAVGNNEGFALHKYRELFKSLSIESMELNLKYTRGKHKKKWGTLSDLMEEKLSDLEIVNREVPGKWSLIREELTKRKKEKYIQKDDFYEICGKEEIGLTKEQGDLCLLYLKALGDLVYFEDRDLRTHIFLDHNWLTEGVYYILSDKKIEKNRGKFTRDQAYEKWEKHDYSEEAKAMLLRLMLKDQFDLCYEISKDTFITPLLLPADKPEASESFETNLHFRYQYGFMPHGMFSRAIVRIHKKIDGKQRWKSGVRLLDTETGARAEVHQFNDPEENQQVIDIKVNGTKASCKSLLDFIRTNVEPLHKEFKNLKIYRKVGCNCAACKARMKAGENPAFYDYKELQAKIQNCRYFIDCPNDNYNPVNIGQILSEVVTEDAGEKSNDSELLYKLKEVGMSINQIINNNKNEANPVFHNENKPVITTTISVEVKVEVGQLLEEISALKDDLENELVIEGVPEKEVQKLVKDVELAEKALEEVESTEQAPTRQAKTRIKRLFDDLQDENSSLRNGLKKLRKGRDYGVKLAETYNKIAGNIGMPMVPPLALDVIKSI